MMSLSSSAVRGPGRGGAAGLSRVKAKLKLAIENGNFYEAHQMYRTMYFRLQTQEKYSELEPLLYEGSLLLFENNQFSSGVDLAKLYVQILSQGNIDKGEEVFQKIARLYSFIPASSPEKDGIMASAIQWSAPKENKSFGSPRLHQIVAYTLWNCKRYPESRHHFLQSFDGLGCGTMMAEFQTAKGYPREVDIFVVGTVLQLICLKKHIVAAMALKSYTEKHPSITKGPPYKFPMLNFVWLLLLAIEHKKSLSAFTVLVEKYKPALNRDPSFLEYIDKIGQNFFNLPPPERPPQNAGMLSGILDSLMTAFNNDGSEEDEQQSSRNVQMETEDLD